MFVVSGRSMIQFFLLIFALPPSTLVLVLAGLPEPGFIGDLWLKGGSQQKKKEAYFLASSSSDDFRFKPEVPLKILLGGFQVWTDYWW